ncbi:MAG: hypothetical protein E6H66_13225 [Betaproteobacteria bacterium]|nr:MAG: hypothetical protein E6H66_13225 [Betaproteobacteria bacterium]
MPAPPLRGQPEPVPAPAARRDTPGCRAGKFGVAGVLGLALFWCAGTVFAQLSGTLSVLSDYRYRGISLSDNEPAFQLGLTYDDALGWYAGAFVSTVESALYETHGVQAIAFAGYAWRMTSGLTVEAGADYSVVTAAPRFDYTEIYAGFAFQNITGRVYYSPRYFGSDSPAVYGELNLAQPLQDNIQLLAHIGILGSSAKPSYYMPYPASSGAVIDGAVGIGMTWQSFNLQLSWVGVNHASSAYGVTGTGNRNGVVASLSYAF